MSNNPFSERVSDPLLTDEERRERAGHAFWSTLGTLYRWRRFIIGVTGVAAVLAVVLSLMMTNWYQAETRLLLPPRSSAGLASAAVLDNLPSAARSLLGGAGGDYLRYLSVLTSRTMYEGVVDAFDLVQVYDVAESDTPLQDAIDFLEDNTDFIINEEYEFLAVTVLDTDPQRAADMANFFVTELERINSELASKSASHFRRYAEQRYEETEAAFDSVLAALRTFQETYGVLELSTQGELYLSFLAELRVVDLKAESEYEMLLSQYGPNNPLVQVAREATRSAHRNYQGALAGRESLLPIPKDQLPGVSLDYLELERERLILATMIEFTRPMLEEARFDEERQIEAVQVVDVAVPPAKKAKPRRSIICIVTTLSAFILAAVFALAYTWWQQNHALYARRLQEAVAHAPIEPGTPDSKPVVSS